MDLNFFRRFFNGNFERDSFGDFSFSGINDDDGRNHRRSDDVFQDPFDCFESHTRMFQRMDEIFNKMFSSFGSVEDFPKFEEHLLSPRSVMIKDSDERISESSSCEKNFGEHRLLPDFGSGKGFMETPHFSFLKFSSVKTVRLPDGTFEEHRTMTDSSGKKTTTVRRSIGGTSHEIITKSDKEGIKEKEENFINMDESELSNFEKKWNSLKDNQVVGPTGPSLSLPFSSPSYLYLLKKFFSPSEKEEVKFC